MSTDEAAPEALAEAAPAAPVAVVVDTAVPASVPAGPGFTAEQSDTLRDLDFEAAAAERRARLVVLGAGDAVQSFADLLERAEAVVAAMVGANAERAAGYAEMTRFLTDRFAVMTGEAQALGRALEGSALFGKAVRRERARAGLEQSAAAGAGRWGRFLQRYRAGRRK